MRGRGARHRPEPAGDKNQRPATRSTAVDGGATFAPGGVLPFRPWRSQASPLPKSFFSDAPEKVRIEIERDGAAFRRRSLPATSRSSGEFSFLLFLCDFLLGIGYFGVGIAFTERSRP
jgi:hypothetical protein